MMKDLYKKCIENSDKEENEQFCRSAEKIRRDDEGMFYSEFNAFK